MKFTILSLGMAMLVAACGVEPHDQHPDNFKKGLQAYHDKTANCYLQIQLPFTVTERTYDPYKPSYDALIEAGVVEFKKTGVFREEIPNRGTVVTTLGTYSLKPEYMSAYTPPPARGQVGCFTGRKITVSKILDYTDATDVGGFLVLEVNYQYTVSGLPDWLDNPKMAEQYPELLEEYRAHGGPVTRKRPLALINGSWVAQ